MSDRHMTWLAWILSAALVLIGISCRYADTPAAHLACDPALTPPLTLAVVVRSESAEGQLLDNVDVYWIDPARRLPPPPDADQPTLPSPPAPDVSLPVAQPSWMPTGTAQDVAISQR